MTKSLLIALTLTAAVGCGKKNKSTSADTGGGKGVATEVQQNVGGGGGGGGGVMAGKKAVGRVLSDQEASQFGADLESTMLPEASTIPTKSFVLKNYKGKPGYDNIVAMLESGELVWLDGASRGGMWAYTKNPDNNKSHMVLMGGRATRVNGQDLAAQLGRAP